MNKNVMISMIGLAGGLMGGAVGDAGGAIMLPGLMFSGIITDYKLALGTVMLALIMPISIGAAYLYWKDKKMNIRVGFILAFFNFIGALISSYIVIKYVSEKYMFLIYALYLFGLGAVFFKKYYTSK